MLAGLGVAFLTLLVAVGAFFFTLIACERMRLWSHLEIAAIIPMLFFSALAAIIAAFVTLSLFLDVTVRVAS